jgi:uncharacterized protein (DUF1501 family)
MRLRRRFDLDQETPEMRARYGRNIYGQSTLLARRLVEAGTRFVTLSWAPDANATWDTHGDNFNKLKKVLLPEFDAACSSLLQDLDDRGLLEKTLVCVLGDFGRTPKINANAGRDHWNSCYTVMLAGGGDSTRIRLWGQRPNRLCSGRIPGQSRRCDGHDLSPAGHQVDDTDPGCPGSSS